MNLGNRYGIELQVINCATGAKFARVTNEAETRNDLVRVLGVTATQVRHQARGVEGFHRQVQPAARIGH